MPLSNDCLEMDECEKQGTYATTNKNMMLLSAMDEMQAPGQQSLEGNLC